VNRALKTENTARRPDILDSDFYQLLSNVLKGLI